MLQDPLRACALCALLLLPAAPAAAQELAPLNGLEIWAIGEGLVATRFSYEGGACDRTIKAEVAAPANGIAAVSVPTLRLSEICTMQIVPVDYSGVLAIDPTTTELEITVLDPDGKPVAKGSVALGP